MTFFEWLSKRSKTFHKTITGENKTALDDPVMAIAGDIVRVWSPAVVNQLWREFAESQTIPVRLKDDKIVTK